MTIPHPSRVLAFALVALIAAFLALASPALAGPLDPVQDAVSNTVNGTTDAVNDASGGVKETVDQTTQDVTNAVNDTTNDVTNTVDQTTQDVTDTVTDTVNDTVDTVTDTTGGGTGGTVGGVTETVKDLSNGVTETLGKEVRDTLGNTGLGGASSELGNSVLGNEVRNGGAPDSRGGTVDGRTSTGAATGSVPTTDSALGRFVDGFAGARGSSGVGEVIDGTTGRAHASFWQAAADAATEAVKRFAFPLILLALVGVFVLLHGMVGRKDPKLALAPVEADHDALAFE